MPERQPQGLQAPGPAPGPGGRASGPPLWAGALAGAALQFLAFPPVALPALAHVCLVPLFLASFGVSRGARARVRRIFWAGYLSQAAFYAALLHWLLFLSKEEVTIPWIMVPALAAICGYLALFAGAAWAIPAWLHRRFGWSPLWSFPVFWVAFDWLRCQSEIAFPWGSLAYALAPWPAGLQLGSLVGYWGHLLWIVGTNALLAVFIGTVARGHRAPSSAWKRAGAIYAITLLVPWIGGGLGLARARHDVAWLGTSHPASLDAEGRLTLPEAPEQRPPDGSASPGPGALRFALLQANTPREIKWNDDYREIVVDDLLDKTEDAVARFQPDLVIWPETAAPLRVLWERDLAEMVSTRIDALDTWVLVGTLDAMKIPESDTYEHYNSAVLFDPAGRPRRRYAKRQMVPFGEYTPYLDAVPWLASLDFGQSDFTPGRESGVFLFGDEALPAAAATSLICFEAAFPELSRRDVRDGARFLVNITNDFWFGKSAGPAQHAYFPILRAVETRTPMIRCANTGHSFIVDAYGRTHGWTELFTPATLAAAVLPNDGGSLYVRLGDWPVLAIGLAFLAVAFARREHLLS